MRKFAAKLAVFSVCVAQQPDPAFATGEQHFSALYTFMGGTDGCQPVGNLVADVAGNLYGTTMQCGASNYGTVFKLTPPANPQTQWFKTTLYNFTNGEDGAYPTGGLAIDGDGNLYGTTSGGGGCKITGGCGTVFELSPPRNGHDTWTEGVLHRFHGYNDGSIPVGTPVLDSQNNVFGVTQYGGLRTCSSNNDDPGCGIAFKIGRVPSLSYNVIHIFGAAGDGSSPDGGLLLASNGNFYGTTQLGGSADTGTIFEMTPPPQGQTSWGEELIYQFSNSEKDGAYPDGTLVSDMSGNLYGPAYGGGEIVCHRRPFVFGCGAVFELSPPSEGQSAWTLNLLYAFGNKGPREPFNQLVIGSNGVIHGTVTAQAEGYVYGLTPPPDGQGSWTEAAFSMGGKIGSKPSAGLTLLPQGQLYGVAQFGGMENNVCAGGCGTVYQYLP